MKPLRIAGFIVVIIAVVLLTPFFYSQKSISLPGVTLRLPGNFFEAETLPVYKDISKITGIVHESLEDDSLQAPQKKLKTDSAHLKRSVKLVAVEDTGKTIQYFEYPDHMDTLLYGFFNTLTELDKNPQLIRILHYGDSQVEADRITAYYRNQMQRQFGGGGVGMIPVTPLNPASISYSFETSSNWIRYSILNTKRKAEEPLYGNMGGFSRFNSLKDNSSQDKEAWILLKNPNIVYPRAGKFTHCKLLMAGNKAPLYLELKRNNKVLDADFVESGDQFNIVDWKFEGGAQNLLITLKGKDSPNLYALMLDGESGIAVDNIPLRGSTGLEFTRLYKASAIQTLKSLNVKLIILQFGVNAVINLAGNVPLYQRHFQEQLNVFRQARPDIPVIVIGVNDISENTANGYVTNEAVEKVRDAQRNAAFATGCVFWDTYTSMGGKNSMPSWVQANPPLAQKDFTHFNAQGAKIIGEMFYRAMMREYNRFLLKKGYASK